jgi:hypothetical protein
LQIFGIHFNLNTQPSEGKDVAGFEKVSAKLLCGLKKNIWCKFTEISSKKVRSGEEEGNPY